MQISAAEVARLLESQLVGPCKTSGADVEFASITPDSLPESKTPEAEEIARVVEMVREVPDSRDDIVMALRERIEKGEYSVSSEEIADMMLRRMKADRIR